MGILSGLTQSNPTIIGAAQSSNENGIGNIISEAGALGTKGISGIVSTAALCKQGGIINSTVNSVFSGALNEDGTLNAENLGSSLGGMLGIGDSLGGSLGAQVASMLGVQSSTTASLKVDIVKTIEYQYEQEVASHPVETGFEIQDNVVNKPLKISMTVGVSSRPVTWLSRNGKGEHKFKNAYDALVAIRDAKQPVTITRPNMVLTDMFMTSCKLGKTNESTSVMMVELSFTKVVKVTTEKVEIQQGIVDAAAKDKAGETATSGGKTGKAGVEAGNAIMDTVGDIKDIVKPDGGGSTLWNIAYGGKK